MVFLLPARFDCQRLGSANGLVQRTFRAIGYLAHSLWGYGGYWNGSGYGSAYQNSNNAWWGNRMLADGGIDQNVDVSPESLIGIYNATVDEELGKVDEVVDAIAYSGHRPTLDINADTGGALIQSGRSADTLPPGTQGMMPQDDSRSLKPVEGLAEELGFAAAKNSARTDRELNAVSSSGANTAQMFSEEARSGEAAAEAGPVTLELESRKEGQIPVEVVKDLIEKGLATVVQATDHERSWGEWWRNHPGRDVPSKEYVAVSDVFGDEIRTLVLELVPYRAAQHHHGRLMTGTTPARDAHYKIVDSGQGQALTLNSSQYGTLDRSRVEEILAQRRAKDYSEVVADLYHDRLTERKLANRAAIAEFTLHMIPLGAAADYASQGDFKEAGISLVGDAATLIGGPLTRVAGFAKYTKAVKAAKISAMVLEGGIGAERLREGWAIYSKTGDASQAAGYFGEAALRLLGVSAQAASKIKPANVLKIKPANALAPVVKKISYTLCFDRGTPVVMKEGTKPIGQVQPGDVVVGLNAIGGERQLSRVVERHDNLYSGDVVEVKIGEEPVIATAGHPFWVVQGDSLDQRPIPGELADATKVDGMAGRWVDSVDLQAGDQLLAADGHPVAVDAVTISHRDNLPVSNLTVEGDHCYHVGDAGVLVHNQAWCDLLKKKIGPAPQSLITAMESLRRAGQIAAGTGVHAHHIVMKTIPTKLAARMHPETAGRMREVLLKSHKILKDAKINSLWPNADGVVGAFAKTLPADKLDNLCWAINGKIGDDPLHTLRYAEKVLELLEEGALDGPDGVRAVLAVMRKKFHRAEVFW